MVIAGRTIQLKTPTSAQVLLLHRASMAATAAIEALDVGTDKDKGRAAQLGLEASGRVLDIVERFVTLPEDRQWLIDRMLEGTIDLPDLHPLIKALGADAEDAPVQAVTRGKAKRS